MKRPKAINLLYLMGVVALVLLAGLAAMPRATGEKEPPKDNQIKISKAAKECIDCHASRKIAFGAIRDWKLSKHALRGVGCNVCHIPSEKAPDSIKNSESKCENPKVRRSVSPKNCELCHSDRVQEFESGKHFYAWDAMMAMPTTKDQPSVIIEGEKGCGGCHRIGRDGGKCDSCHTRHRFSAAEARKPVACQTCHMGFDHPQWEMYSTSKHGTIYSAEGQDWDWDVPLAQWFNSKPLEPSYKRPRAPACATCHMPEGNHAVKTAWGFLGLRLPEKDKEWEGYRNTILKGLGVLDPQGNPTERIKAVEGAQVVRLTEEEWQAERDKMLNVCNNCHAPTFAKEQLDKADQVIKESDRLMAEAIEIVEGLYRQGVLERPKEYPLHTDLLRFYEVRYPIEQKLYTMFLEHRMRSFQGAFHFNPDYQHWYGWAEMKRDLVEIRHEAEELRRGR